MCSDDEASFQVAIEFDFASYEISWVLQDSCSGEKLVEKEYGFGVTSDLYQDCIPKSQYIFSL